MKYRGTVFYFPDRSVAQAWRDEGRVAVRVALIVAAGLLHEAGISRVRVDEISVGGATLKVRGLPGYRGVEAPGDLLGWWKRRMDALLPTEDGEVVRFTDDGAKISVPRDPKDIDQWLFGWLSIGWGEKPLRPGIVEIE